MALYAMTREVSPRLERCELTHLPRRTIEVTRAVEQHRAYQMLLAELGAAILPLPPVPECPDGVFVEDTCVVLDEMAIIGPMGAVVRRREAKGLAETLSPFRDVVQPGLPGTIDGGDVLHVGRTLYVGVSGRTNEQGCANLREAIAPFGYAVRPIKVKGCLHLKSAVTCVGNNLLLSNPDWVDSSALADMEVIETHPDEPFAANALRIGDTLVYPVGFPRTLGRLRARGLDVRTVDVSELQKAEAGVTCMSVLFEHPRR